MTVKRTLILPVENQVRELDSKLLLACVAAERGVDAILGYRTQLDFRAARLPRGVYISKSMTPKSSKMFRILRLLGHDIAVWDEEALVYLSSEHYYERRMSAQTLAYVSLLFAWGRDNEEMFRKYPGYSGTPIRVVGNPRIDLLRPELRSYFDEEVRRIRDRHGRYVLINTNFSMVNGFLDTLNLFKPASSPGAEPELGAAGIGTSREFAAGYAAHKGALFAAFRGMLPALGEAFPQRTFVVRPHPSEKPEPWVEAARPVPNVKVLHEGNVIPWLLASDVLIHNGCTTAVEAWVLGVPAISYRPVCHELYDFDLPNSLSHQCKELPHLLDTLSSHIRRQPCATLEARPPRPFEEYVSALAGPLASERIVDALLSGELGSRERPPLVDRLRGRVGATQRALVKQYIKARVPGHRNNPEFQRHRFPGVSADELRRRVAQLGRILGRFEGVRVESITPAIFHLYV